MTVEPATGRVFVSRGTHVMVVEGATGKVLGDIPDTPGVHGAGLVTKAGHGFTTNGGDQTVTMFDLKTLAVIKQIKVGPGLDGIMYDAADDKVILTNHSRPIGTLTALDPTTGDIVATVELEDTSPEGAATDGKGHIFVNNEGKNTIQVDRRQDVEGDRVVAARVRAMARRASRTTRRRIASSPAATRRRSCWIATTARSWRPSRTAPVWMRSAGILTKKLIYIPNGGEGNVTVVHQDSAGHVLRRGHDSDVPGSEDDHGRPDDAQRLPVSAGAWSRAAARARRAAARRRGRGRGPRGPVDRGVVHRDQAVAPAIWRRVSGQ